MMASRGMGDINPDKVSNGKKIVRKDSPNNVDIYQRGGKTKTHKQRKGK